MNRYRKGTPEGRLKLQILRYLKALGAAAGKTNTMAVKRGKVYCFDPYIFRGHPDILCFWKERIYYIEVKSPKGKQTPEQESFQLLCSQIPDYVHYILAYEFGDVERVIK